MFDKSSGPKFAKVTITLVDGREFNGELLCGLNGSITTLLNDTGQFVEMTAQNGKRIFISKHQIKTVEPPTKINESTPELGLATFSNSDWTKVLGVASSSTPDQVREAYHVLAKRYHPDLYAEHFPVEIRKYASDMFARINVAYDHSRSQQQVA
ncbi:MAG: J domain-containing protein [Rhizobiaceae bacterium]